MDWVAGWVVRPLFPIRCADSCTGFCLVQQSRGSSRVPRTFVVVGWCRRGRTINNGGWESHERATRGDGGLHDTAEELPERRLPRLEDRRSDPKVELGWGSLWSANESTSTRALHRFQSRRSGIAAVVKSQR